MPAERLESMLPDYAVCAGTSLACHRRALVMKRPWTPLLLMDEGRVNAPLSNFNAWPPSSRPRRLPWLIHDAAATKNRPRTDRGGKQAIQRGRAGLNRKVTLSSRRLILPFHPFAIDPVVVAIDTPLRESTTGLVRRKPSCRRHQPPRAAGAAQRDQRLCRRWRRRSTMLSSRPRKACVHESIASWCS